MRSHRSFVLFAAVIPLILFAAEEETHVSVGSRPTGEESVAQGPILVTEEEETLESAGKDVHSYYPPISYSKAHHYLTRVAIQDDNTYAVEIEDGSVWKIGRYDHTKAIHWLANDPLVITQNNRWFSKYQYQIVNKSKGHSVEANLFLGPILNGPHSRFVTAINKEERLVYLSDNTHWDISYLDQSTLKDWLLNDYVIVGSNSKQSFWDKEREALLINVNTNKAVRATQY